MNSRFLWLAGLVLMLAAGSVQAGTAVQMWNCGMADDASEESVQAQASKWLAAAKKVDGGENMEAYVLFPVAVNATGDTDMVFVVIMPSFAEWGKFWDAYPDSDAADGEDGKVFCPDSVVWESVKVE